jgi:peptidoglycan hydrolase-like protein with peptidoglycan-binding domain
MKRTSLLTGLLFLAVIAALGADETIASAQQALKDQGFYYGEITGRKDTDTTAAIRRYQIRNGLKITGELDAETQRSLRATGTAAPQPRTTNRPRPPDDTSELRDNNVPPEPPSQQYRSPRDVAPPIYTPEPYRFRQETVGIFQGTPFETATSDIQQRVIADAQIFLARRGYYHSDIDGIYGPGTEFALRAFQSRSGLPPTGRFDIPTLGALGLMPRQRAPSHPFFPRPFPHPIYRGEWIPG